MEVIPRAAQSATQVNMAVLVEVTDMDLMAAVSRETQNPRCGMLVVRPRSCGG
jgi:hypothetical protein